MWMAGIGPPVLGVEVGPYWAGVGVPVAGEVVGEPWKMEVVAATPLEVVKCLGVVLWVALGLGLGEAEG